MLFVNLPATADKVQINAPEFQIKLVENAIVPNAEFEFATPLRPGVRKTVETRTHFIHFALHGISY